MSRVLRVLFVIENYIPHIGGAEIVFKNLAEGLVRKGFHVDLVTHRLKNTKTFEIINGVRVHRIRCFDSRYLFTFFAVPKALRLARKADIIHTTTFNGAPPAWLCSRLAGKKCIITVHEVWVGNWRALTDQSFISAFFHNLLEKMIYLLPFDKYACVSKNTQNGLLRMGITFDKTAVVYNGIDYEHFNPKRYDGSAARKKLGLGNAFVYLFYGRPGPSKGVEYLVKAARHVANIIPRSKLLLILSKDAAYKKRRDALKRAIENSSLNSHVILHDPVPWHELPTYIKAADCVVVPSLAEGFGFSAAESCALGKPVIATTAGSLPEVVSGKYILVKPRSPEALAEGVINAYHGKTTYVPPKRFAIRDNIYQYTTLYHFLLRGK